MSHLPAMAGDFKQITSNGEKNIKIVNINEINLKIDDTGVFRENNIESITATNINTDQIPNQQMKTFKDFNWKQKEIIPIKVLNNKMKTSNENKCDGNNFQETNNSHISKDKSIDSGLLSNTANYSTSRNEGSSLQANETDPKDRQMKAARTVIVIVCGFFTCWTPFFVALPIEAACDCVPPVVFTAATWLGYANSALNPFIYLATNAGFRRNLLTAFGTTSSSAQGGDMTRSNTPLRNFSRVTPSKLH